MTNCTTSLSIVFGKRMRKLRESKGITQLQLADEIGSRQCTIATYEIGDKIPPLEKARKIAIELGCSLDYLVGDKETYY